MKTFFKQAKVTMPFGHYFLSLIMLPALMLLLSMNVMAQSEVVTTNPPWEGTPLTVYICVGGTVTVQVENSEPGHIYRIRKTNPTPAATIQDLVGNGGTITFDPIDIFSSSGNVTIAVRDVTDDDPDFTFDVNIVSDPLAPVMAKVPTQTEVCAGTNISATVSSNGSGGVTGSNDKFQYSTDGGNSWVTYTPGVDIPTTGLSGSDIVQIRSWRADDEGRGCNSGYNIYKWTVNALPVPTITGDSDVCSGSVKTYVTQSGMTNYLWTIDGGTDTSATNSIDVTWGSEGAGKVSVNFTDGKGCTALSPTEYMVDKVDAPDINSIIIQSTTDQLVWQDLPGDIGAGFSMFLNPTAQFMYLDVKTFTATTDIMSNHLHPFYLDQANLPAGWDQYWIDRGVVSGAAGWQGVMHEIITGDEPIFYLYKTGSDYQLIDGLQYQIGQGMQMLRVSGDYPAGEYTYNGILYSTLGCSSELSIDMTYSKKVLNVTQQKTYGTIQDAIDDANSAGGDLINVYEGSYEENLNIDKSLTLKPASGEEVIIQGYGGVMDPEEPGFGDLDIGIFIDADNVTVEGLIITGFDWGIDIWGENNIISGNNVSEASGAGISIYGADNIINGNILNDNYEAVVVSETSGNLIQDNRIFDNGVGLVNNTPDWINVASNWWGDSSGPESNPYNTCGQGNLVSDYVIFWPWFTDDAEEPMVSTATLSVTNISKAPNTAYCKIQDAIDDAGTSGETIVVGDGIYYENIIINKANLILVNGSLPVIDGGGNGTVVTITANDITFEGFSVQNSGSTQNDAGIFLQNVTGCTVKSNNITSNAHGIALAYGSANILYDNEINGNSYYGVAFAGTSGNTIELNTIGANGLDAIALDNASAVGGSVSTGSNGNFIKTNTISSSLRDGIFIGENCTTNQITDQNEINDITGIGIHVWRDGAQVISDNIINNTLVGIKLRGAVNSVISGNVISGNATGLEIEQFYLGGNWYTSDNNTIEHNNIYDNTTGVKADNNGGVMVDVTCNWWGTGDSYEVEQFLSGSIQFLPFLNENASGDIEPWWSSGQKYSCEGYGPVLVYDNDPATGSLVSSHMTIQGAIDAATTSGGYYIIVNEGIYTENITISGKNGLVLMGPNAGLNDAKGTRAPEATVVAAANAPVFTIEANVTSYTIDGLNIVGADYMSGSNGRLIWAKGTTSQSNILNNKLELTSDETATSKRFIWLGPAVSGNSGAMYISGNVKYNHFKAGGTGSRFNGIITLQSPLNFEISYNWFEDMKGQRNILVWHPSSTTVIKNNDLATTDYLDVIWLGGPGAQGGNAGAVIENNTFSSDGIGIGIHSMNYSPVIKNNNFENITGLAIEVQSTSGSGGTVDATCNWWGATDPATIEASVSGSVVMAPWLVDGTDGDLATAGFQPATPCVTCDLTASAFAVNASCSNISDGEVSVTPADGTAPYSYLWSNSSTDSTVVNLAVGSYTVTVTDLAGCTATASATIGVIPNTGTTWYVNDNLLAGDVYTTNTGDNANTGTAACPLATLNFAISLASDDDIIYVDAGTYTENVLINRPLTLLGANADIPYGDISRGAESTIQPSTSGSTPLSLSGFGISDNVTINGFAITGDMSNNGIYCGGDGPSNLNIIYNYIYNIGINRGSGNVYAINYRVNNPNTNNVNFSDNYITNVFRNTSAALGHSAAIWVGQSTANGIVSNLTIERNVISNIYSGLSDKAATGISLEAAWGAGTGGLNSPLIKDNTISNINGGIAYGIQLTGKTPGAIVTNNLIDDITGLPANPQQAVGVTVPVTNTGFETVMIHNNSITNAAYAIYNGNTGPLQATSNWFGSDEYTDIYHVISGPVKFVQYLLSDELDPLQPLYAEGGGPSLFDNLILTHSVSSQNVFVQFDIEDGDMELYPVPGLDPAHPDYLAQVEGRYLALAAAIVSGVPAAIQTAALAVGDDVIAEYYYMDGANKVYLQTVNNNQLIKNKYWNNYLVRDDDVRYPNWPTPGNPDPVMRTLVLQDHTYRTHTNPGTGAVAFDWLDPVRGKDLYVTVTVIQNGDIYSQTDSVFIPVGVVQVYDGDPDVVSTNLVSSHMTIQGAIDAATTLDGYFVTVDAGNYDEQVTVNKQLDIRGPYWDESPNTGARNPAEEAIIVPPVNYLAGLPTSPSAGQIQTAGEANAVVYITADGVLFRGFTISGDNPAIDGFDYVGMNVESATAVEADASELVFSKNIVEKAIYIGLHAIARTKYHSDVEVDDNLYREIHDPSGYGFAMYMRGAVGSVTNNTVQNSRVALQVQPYNAPHSVEVPFVKGNTFSTWRMGIYYNLIEGDATGWEFEDNTISMASPPVGYSGSIPWTGVRAQSIRAGGGLFKNNTIDGTKPSGSDIWSAVYGLRTISVRVEGLSFVGNIISNMDIAHLNEPTSTSNALITLTGNSLTENVLSIQTNTHGAVLAICNWWGTEDVDDIDAFVSGDVQFLPFLVVDNSAAGTPYWWDNSTPPNKYSCDGLGPVKIYNGDPALAGVLVSSHMKIQEAIDASTTQDGFFVTVDAGTYNEQVLVTKSLNITGVGTTQPVVLFTGTVVGKPTLFDVSMPDVTIENFQLDADLTKLSSGIIASATNVNNIAIKNNTINAVGTSIAGNFGAYGNRNAVSVNYGGPINYRVAAGGVNNIVFEGNTVTGTVDDGYGQIRFFRSGISTDESGGIFTGNTLATINHDILVRFAGNGNVNVTGNYLNGGGMEFSDFNAGADTLTISGNEFNGAAANTYSNALRLKNNYTARPTLVSNNNFSGFVGNIPGYGGILSLENYQEITIDNNTFMPLANSTDFRHITINTKEFTSSSGFYAPVVGATLTNNTFYGSGVDGGLALGFYNWDNDSPVFNAFVIGTSGNENTFNDGIATYIYLDNSTGTALPNNTDMEPWAVDLNTEHNYFATSTPTLPSAMTLTQLFALEDKVFHAMDDENVGFVTWVPSNVYVTTNTLGIQRGVDVASENDTVHVSLGTYYESVLIDNMALTILGAGVGQSIIDGLGLTANALVRIANISSGSLLFNGFTIQNIPLNIAGNARFPVSISQCNDPAKVTFTNNHIIGSGSSESGVNQWGLYVNNSNGEFVLNQNTIDGIMNNSILIERVVGPVEIGYNTINVPDYDAGNGIFSMSYKSGSNEGNVDALHRYHNNIIRSDDQITGWGIQGGIVVASAFGNYYGQRSHGAYTNLVIENNKIEDIMPWYTIGKAIQLEIDGPNGGFNGVQIIGNEISASSVNTDPVHKSRGIRLLGDVNDPVISGNILTDFYYGIHLRGTFSELLYPNNVLVNENSFVDNLYGIINETDNVADATCNWYGTTDANDVAAMITGLVDYTPYLIDGTDASPDPGFQPSVACVACDLTASAIATDASCSNIYDGTATVTPAYGTVPYTYLWSNAATTQFINGLTVGTYTVTVTDLAGCTATASATVGVVPHVAGTDWFVNDNDLAGDIFTTNIGNDANPGTSVCPFATVNYAITMAEPGDTIKVDAGLYEESLASWKDMEITKSISLIGAGSGQTIFGLTQGKSNGVEIRGSNLDVHLEGITFTKRTGSTYASDFGLRIGETSSSFNSFILRDVEVAYAQGRNVFFGAAGSYENVLVEDCNFHHAGSWGVTFAGPVDSLVVKNSDFTHNGQVDASQGIGLDFTAPGPHQNILIENSNFSNNLRRGINALNIKDAVVRDVTANNNGTSGFQIWNWAGNTENVLFENCTVTGNGQDGVQIAAESGLSVSGITFDGGTYSNNARNNIRFHNGGGTVNNITIKNATLSRLTSSPGSAQAVVFVHTVNGITFENNNFTQEQIHWNVWLMNLSSGAVVINGNIFNGTYGVAAWTDMNTSLLDISGNAFLTTELGLYNHENNDPYSATCNWWGTEDSYEVADLITGNVQFLPYLVVDNSVNGDTYWWDDQDDYSCDGVGPVRNISKNSSYMTILAATNDADENNEIEVDAGEFNETVTINKSLKLTGAGCGQTIWRGNAVTDRSLVIVRDNSNPENVHAEISGFSFETEKNQSIRADWSAAYSEALTLDIHDNCFKHVNTRNPGTDFALYVDGAMQTPRDSEGAIRVYDNLFDVVTGGLLFEYCRAVDVLDNVFNVTYEAVAFNYYGNSGTCGEQLVKGNVFHHVPVDWAFAINNWHGVGTYTVLPSEISNNIFTPSGFSYAIAYGLAASQSQNHNILISNNSIESGSLMVWGDYTNQAEFDARCNWWGTVNPVSIAGKISGNTSYIPWLTDGTDESPDPGFQPEEPCDQTPPDITCPIDLTVQIHESSNPSATGFATAIDDGGGPVYITFADTWAAGIYPGTGVVTRTWKATDQAGNDTTCVQLVTLIDTYTPQVICPAGIDTIADDGMCSALLDYEMPVVYDPGYSEGWEDPDYILGDYIGWMKYNSIINSVLSGTDGITSKTGNRHGQIIKANTGSTGIFSRIGGYSNSFCNGYRTSIDVYMDLNDSSVINNTYGWDLSVASSNQDGNHLRDFIFHTASNDSGEIFVGASNNSSGARRNDLHTLNHHVIDESGWYTFEWIFRDNGSDALAVDLSLLDENGDWLWTETRTTPADTISTIVGGNRYMWFTFIATDKLAVDNAMIERKTNVVTDFASGSAFPVGTTTVTLVSTDCADNNTNCSFDMTVEDTQKPVIACVADQTRNTDFGVCSYTAVGTEFDLDSAWDNCEILSIVNDYNSDSTLAGAVFPLGTTTVVWTVTDIHNNVESCSFEIEIVDNVPPVISIIGNNPFTICRYETYTDEGATALDICDGDITGLIQITNSVNTAIPGTYTVVYDVTDDSGNSAQAIRTVNVISCGYALSGNFKYHNNAQTPLANVHVELQQNGVTLYDTITDANGNYSIHYVAYGTYDVVADCTLPTGGAINSLDAGQVNAWGVGPQYMIEKVRFLSADVLRNNYIDAGDAGRINTYFIYQGNPSWSGSVGLWSFWKANDPIIMNFFTEGLYPTVTITSGSSNIVQNFYGMVTGDFNRSFVPGGAKSNGSVQLLEGNTIAVAPDEVLMLPVSAGFDMTVGAISLILNYPEDLIEIEDIFLADDPSQAIPFHASNNQLRMGWFNNVPVYGYTDQALFIMKVRVKSSAVNGQVIGFTLATDPLNELGDNHMEVIQNATLIAGKLKVTATGIDESVTDHKLSILPYPNPATETVNINYVLPVEGRTTIKIYDQLGRLVLNQHEGLMAAARHTYQLNVSAWSTGIYTVSIVLESESGVMTGVSKIVVHR